jgi:CMP-N-acetylneuraminic acid synthetase
MVTTDSEKIQRIALKYGANSPFLRPQDLATDTATSFDAVKHTIEFYEKKLGKTYDYLVLLQPTSPLRTSINIEQALHLLIEKQADAIISVSLMEHNPLKSNLLPENLSLEKFQP